MDVNTYVEIIRLFMVGMFQLALPILIFILIVALFFGVIQSVTQIQEQSLTFFPKLLTLVVIFIVGGSWMYNKSVATYQEYFEQIIKLF